MNRPNFETLGLVAALALSGCCDENKNGREGRPHRDEVVDTGTPVDTATDTAADTSSDTDSGADTDTGLAEVTPFTQAVCERLRGELSSALDDLSLVQFVQSLGVAECTRDDRTFGDSMFEATLKDEVVGACVWNGEGTSADETRVTRVPATDAYPATLSVEAEIDSSGGVLILGFYDNNEQLLAPYPGATNPLWAYGDEAGRCRDTSNFDQ